MGFYWFVFVAIAPMRHGGYFLPNVQPFPQAVHLYRDMYNNGPYRKRAALGLPKSSSSVVQHSK